jgi:hypothetical protein
LDFFLHFHLAHRKIERDINGTEFELIDVKTKDTESDLRARENVI